MGIDFEGLKNNDNTFGNQRRGGFDRWKASPGENVIRLLPPNLEYFKTDINYFSYVFNNHFVTLGKDQFEVFRCLRDHPDSVKCPACTFFFKYRNHSDDNVSKMATRFRNSVRHLMNILVIETESSEDTPEGVQTFECGPGVYEDLKEYAANKRYGDIFNPKTGRNIILKLIPASESPTRRNQYKVSPDVDKSNVVHLLGEDWKEKISGLEEKVPDFPELDYVHQVVDTAAELVDLEVSTTRVASAGSPVTAPKDETEEEVIEDEDDVFGAEDKLPWEDDDEEEVEEVDEDDSLDGLLDDDSEW